MASATFIDAGGGKSVGRCQLGPQIFGTYWHVTSISISSNEPPDVTESSQCRIYKNVEMPSAFVEGTSAGAGDTSDSVIDLQTLDSLLFVFTGTDEHLGYQGNAILSGTVETGRN